MSDGPLNEKQKLQEQARLERLERIQRDADLRRVMGTPEGRRLMWRITAHMCGLYSGTFTGEALTSAHAEGRRSVGRDLMVEAQAVAPGAYVAMVSEQMAAVASKSFQTEPAPNEEPEE